MKMRRCTKCGWTWDPKKESGCPHHPMSPLAQLFAEQRQINRDEHDQDLAMLRHSEREKEEEPDAS